MKQLIRYTSIVAIFILSIFMYGCEDEELVIEVFAGFTHTTDTETGTVTFINTSENAEGFSWDFGDGTTSTEINPAKTYVTGTYVVQLTATNDDISDVFTDTISIFVPEAISLPATFDDSNVEYIATVFNGASFEVVDNPDLSGVNNMATKVGKVTNIGAAFEGLFFDLGVPIDLSTKMSITMKFWSDTPIDILLKLEEGTTAPIETSASHGGTGWEMITFNFSSTATFSRLTLFVDAFGTATGSFYFDDISQEETGDITAPIITLNGDVMMELQVGDVFTDPGATAMDDVDGDISANIVVGGDVVDTSTEGTYTITYNVSDAAGNAATEATRTVNVGPAVLFPIDFEDGFAFSGAFDNGANGSNADNPNPSGINTSAKVYQFNKVVNSAWYSGMFNIFTQDIDANAGNVFKFKIWSPNAGINIRFQLEKEGNQGPIVTYNIDQTLNTANQWVEMSFDFSSTAINLADGYDKIVIFPDYDETNMVPVATEAIYYIDDVEQSTSSGGGDTTPPVITLNGAATINLTVGDAFTDPGATAMDNVDGDISGNIIIGGDVVDVNTVGSYVITYNVSDAAGNAAAQVTRTVNVAAAGLFPIDFEDGFAFSGTFDNGANGLNADNPNPSGINTSAKVYQFNKVVNSAWYSGMFNIFTQDIDANAGNVFKFKIWSPNAGINIRFQLEKEGNQGPIPTYNIDQTLNTANQWVEMTFDFSATAIDLADGYDKIVIFPDYDETNMVPVATEAIYYIDDVEQSNGSGGGDTTPPVITLNGAATINLTVGDAFTDPGATAMDNVDGDISANIVVGGDVVDVNTVGSYVITYNVSDAAGNAAAQVTRTVNVSAASSALFPIDFEDGSTLSGTFDNGATGLNADNPNPSGINTSAKVYQFNKVVGSAWYSGAFNIFTQDIDPAGGNIFKVKVWSPNAGINFRFQLEKEGNQGPIVTYNVDQTLNTANQWVELTFDFSTTGLNLADGYDKIVIFPDYDETNMVPVATEAIYYFDDITQE